jgi:pyruvate kinase
MMESARTEREAQYFEELNQVTHELCAIHSKTLQAEALFKCKLRNIHVQHQADARNLLHYLALRQHDLRPLQEKLARFGLSSLGRAESHVLAGLDAVLRVLRHLTGDDSSLAVWGCDDFRAGRRALEDNTRTLLGAKPASRDVRIMVTMPSEAATDYGLVRGLVDAGMDCMRINCAHDDESSWAGMVENLKRARRVGPLLPNPDGFAGAEASDRRDRAASGRSQMASTARPLWTRCPTRGNLAHGNRKS